MKRRSVIKEIVVASATSTSLSSFANLSSQNNKMKMWNKTKFTKLLGVEYPIVQGPFGGGLSSVELTTTVANAGCLGSFGGHHFLQMKLFRLAKKLENIPTSLSISIYG